MEHRWKKKKEMRRESVRHGGQVTAETPLVGRSKAIVTVLQVLIALIAAGVARGVAHQALTLGQQLLLGARQPAVLGVAAAWKNTTPPRHCYDTHTFFVVNLECEFRKKTNNNPITKVTCKHKNNTNTN